jgi:hypothetical protein
MHADSLFTSLGGARDPECMFCSSAIETLAAVTVKDCIFEKAVAAPGSLYIRAHPGGSVRTEGNIFAADTNMLEISDAGTLSPLTTRFEPHNDIIFKTEIAQTCAGLLPQADVCVHPALGLVKIRDKRCHLMCAGYALGLWWYSDILTYGLKISEEESQTYLPEPPSKIPAEDPLNPGKPLFLLADNPWFVAMKQVRPQMPTSMCSVVFAVVQCLLLSDVGVLCHALSCRLGCEVLRSHSARLAYQMRSLLAPLLLMKVDHASLGVS